MRNGYKKGDALLYQLGFLLGLGILFSFSRQAFAAAPTIELVNPTPSSVQYLNTQMLYEVRINTCDPGSYTVEWEPFWDGTTETFTPDPAGTQVFDITACPATGIQYPGLRFQKTITGVPVGAKNARVRVTFESNPVLASGRYNVLDSLAFSGYTWTGASTPICIGGDGLPDGPVCFTDGDCPEGDTCGRDAMGWTSYSCANENLVCSTVEHYAVRLGTVGGGTPNATLLDHGWIGDPSGGQFSTGWATFNRKYCSSGDNAGSYCAADGDCPGGGVGSCVALGTPPIAEGENWAGQPSASYLYSSIYDLGGGQKRYPGQVAGWARHLTLKSYGESQVPPQSDWGWMHLRGPEAPQPYTTMANGGFHQCIDCSASKTKCNVCEKVQVNPGDPEESWKKYACNSCYTCDGSGNCDTCEKCDSYGVSYDSQRGRLVGFAWAGGQNDAGLGWTQFDPTEGGIGVLQAWLATRYGDIFAGGPIATSPGTLPSPPGTFNATYVIQANGTIAFTSQAGYLQPNYPSNIELPTAGNQYFNVLGRLDMKTMTQIGVHRYGETVQVTGDLNTYLNTQLPDGRLDGKIYYHQGDAVINNPIEFQPGLIDAQSGAGTIIIDGDLAINAPITYETQQTIGRVVNLPSVTWIVRGNLAISSSVGTPPESATDPNIVGAFLVIGCPGDGSIPCGLTAKEGVVTTGSSSTLQLIVNGLMMAKRFVFERSVPAQEGSEQVIYDGRLLANPPPGLQDLTAVLPVIREVTP